MTEYVLSEQSRNNLRDVHPDLLTCVVVCLYHFTPVDFTVIEGKRTEERQRKLINQGRSWTMDSKHLVQPDGWVYAVDLGPLVNGRIPWKNDKPFADLAKAMKAAALFLRIELVWGGSWKVNDSPHFQLKRIRR